MRIKGTIAAMAASALLLAGCTGNDGEDSPEPDPDGTQEDPAGDDGDEADDEPAEDDAADDDSGGEDPGAGGPAALSEWVEVEPASYFITGAPGLALLSSGEQDLGEVFTRDVAAYDESGTAVWEHSGVRERHNLPEAASAGEHLALIDTGEGVPMLRGLTWADGAEVWSERVEEMVQCTEEVSVVTGTDSAVLIDALGEPCAGTEPRTVAYSLDAATGEVLGLIEATGSVTGTTSPDGSEAWYLQADGDEVQVHTLLLDSGEAGQDVIAFDDETRAALLGDHVQWHSAWPVSDHEVGLVAQAEGSEAALVLADLDSGESRMFSEAAVCAEPGGLPDPASGTCLVLDESALVNTAYDFEGNELWSAEGATGLSFDGDSVVEPVGVGEEHAWLISSGDDLVQARQVHTGEQLWAAGTGEGSGTPSTYHPPGSAEVVLGIQHGSPQTQVLRLDVETGEELDRRDLTDAWVHGDDHVVAVHADEATLLAFVTAG